MREIESMEHYFPTSPLRIPHPSRLILFAPHPDDICISAGALAILAGEAGVRTEMILVTDGSESRIPEHVMRQYGWTDDWAPERSRDLRGRIRVAEAQEEARQLGLESSAVQLLKHQSWHTRHQTEPPALNPDLSVQDIDKYLAGPLDCEAISEVQRVLRNPLSRPVLVAFPDPHDTLVMHRMVAALVALALSENEAKGNYTLLTYRCLTSTPKTYFGQRLILEFGEETMSKKIRAIQAHLSMKERRRMFGGYSSRANEFYDEIVYRWNDETARGSNLSTPFAEEYGLLESPSPEVVSELHDVATTSCVALVEAQGRSNQ